MSGRSGRSSHKLDMSYILNGDDNTRCDTMSVDTPANPTGSKRRPPTHPSQSSDRKFVCPSCSFAFRSKGDMAKHDRSVHQGIKKHVCPQCGARFAEKGNLTKHMKRHEGIREHHCTFPGCTKTFVLKDGLSRHLKSVHGKEDRASSSKSSGTGSSTLHRQSSQHNSSRPRK